MNEMSQHKMPNQEQLANKQISILKTVTDKIEHYTRQRISEIISEIYKEQTRSSETLNEVCCFEFEKTAEKQPSERTEDKKDLLTFVQVFTRIVQDLDNICTDLNELKKRQLQINKFLEDTLKYK